MWAPCETVIYYILYAMYTQHFLFHIKLFYILAAKIKEKEKRCFSRSIHSCLPKKIVRLSSIVHM